MKTEDIDVIYDEIKVCTCKTQKPRFINNNNLDNNCLNCGKPL